MNVRGTLDPGENTNTNTNIFKYNYKYAEEDGTLRMFECEREPKGDCHIKCCHQQGNILPYKYNYNSTNTNEITT